MGAWALAAHLACWEAVNLAGEAWAGVFPLVALEQGWEVEVALAALEVA